VDIINRHGVTLHSFADDTQLYLHCCREDITTADTRLKKCIIDVGRWMSANRLKLNTDKTELLWTGSRHSISQLHGHGPSIQLGADIVSACDHVRLLGVIISADLSLDRHVSCSHFGVLLLATTASTSSPISRRRIGSHTGSRLCYVQGRLLQSAVGRSTKVCYRQVAAGHERCSASCERHEEVQPRLDTAASL